MVIIATDKDMMSLKTVATEGIRFDDIPNKHCRYRYTEFPNYGCATVCSRPIYHRQSNSHSWNECTPIPPLHHDWNSCPEIRSYAVVDGISLICVSMESAGTFWLDVERKRQVDATLLWQV
jgi:hypothetical protein